ncbi:MAG TPA: type II secretion system F family protein, partial [Planctomycetaceae bacterium]|nr:type II secretion system F family protein [Planctomycetaceae bacterium]
KIQPAKATGVQRVGWVRRPRAGQLATFFSQLADLLRAGVPLLRSLELLERQTSHAGLKSVLRDLRDKVADGTRLAEAMRIHPEAFSELSTSMVRAGEEGSFLEDVLKQVADFTEHQQELKSRVIGAMAYPIFLLVAGVSVVWAMLVWFVPKFTPIFDRLAKLDELPLATTMLMSLSEYAGQYWLVSGLLIVGVTLLLRQRLRTEAGLRQWHQLLIRLPALGPVVRSLAISRFCRILGTLLKNGVPILQSLRIAKDATGNRVLTEAIGHAAENVSTGKSLASPLASSGQFPAEVVEMIAVGEEANNLEHVLINIADTMERRTQRLMDLAVRLLEPLLLIVMAGLILFVVIGLLLPVMKSSGTL